MNSNNHQLPFGLAIIKNNGGALHRYCRGQGSNPVQAKLFQVFLCSILRVRILATLFFIPQFNDFHKINSNFNIILIIIVIMFYLFIFFFFKSTSWIAFSLADDEEDKTEVSWLKLNVISFVFVIVVLLKSHTVCQNNIVFSDKKFVLKVLFFFIIDGTKRQEKFNSSYRL